MPSLFKFASAFTIFALFPAALCADGESLKVTDKDLSKFITSVQIGKSCLTYKPEGDWAIPDPGKENGQNNELENSQPSVQPNFLSVAIPGLMAGVAALVQPIISALVTSAGTAIEDAAAAKKTANITGSTSLFLYKGSYLTEDLTPPYGIEVVDGRVLKTYMNPDARCLTIVTGYSESVGYDHKSDAIMKMKVEGGVDDGEGRSVIQYIGEKFGIRQPIAFLEYEVSIPPLRGAGGSGGPPASYFELRPVAAMLRSPGLRLSKEGGGGVAVIRPLRNFETEISLRIKLPNGAAADQGELVWLLDLGSITGKERRYYYHIDPSVIGGGGVGPHQGLFGTAGGVARYKPFPTLGVADRDILMGHNKIFEGQLEKVRNLHKYCVQTAKFRSFMRAKYSPDPILSDALDHLSLSADITNKDALYYLGQETDDAVATARKPGANVSSDVAQSAARMAYKIAQANLELNAKMPDQPDSTIKFNCLPGAMIAEQGGGSPTAAGNEYWKSIHEAVKSELTEKDIELIREDRRLAREGLRFVTIQADVFYTNEGNKLLKSIGTTIRNNASAVAQAAREAMFLTRAEEANAITSQSKYSEGALTAIAEFLVAKENADADGALGSKTAIAVGKLQVAKDKCAIARIMNAEASLCDDLPTTYP